MNPTMESLPAARVVSRGWRRPVAALLLTGGLYGLAAAGGASQAQTFDPPVRLKASDFVAPALLRGDDFVVNDSIENDGLMNIYTVESTFGTFRCVSTAKLLKRIAEVKALRQMEAIKRSDVYTKGIGDSARGTVKTVEKLVTSPVDTISGSVTGIGKAFARTGEAVFGSPRSDAETGPIESLLGVADSKRKFAADFGVDVYSDNEALQARLNELARATTLGELTYSAALSAVPGGAGAAVSATNATKATNEIFRSTAPTDLRAMNRKKLISMGVREDIAEAFIDNARFSPRQQTELTLALESMAGVKGKDYFVYWATRTADDDFAYFRQRQAQMYAGYHAKQEKLQSFVNFGEFLAARSAGGAIVFNLPVDYLVWTKWVADAVAAVDRAVVAMPQVTGKRVVVAGTMSPLARQQLQSAGWVVIDNAEGLISGL